MRRGLPATRTSREYPSRKRPCSSWPKAQASEIGSDRGSAIVTVRSAPEEREPDRRGHATAHRRRATSTRRTTDHSAESALWIGVNLSELGQTRPSVEARPPSKTSGCWRRPATRSRSSPGRKISQLIAIAVGRVTAARRLEPVLKLRFQMTAVGHAASSWRHETVRAGWVAARRQMTATRAVNRARTLRWRPPVSKRIIRIFSRTFRG